MSRSAAYLLSAATAIFITGSIIMAHALSTEFKQSLTNLTGHHWTAVGAVALAIFILASALIYVMSGSEDLARTLKSGEIAAGSTALVTITLAMTLGCLAVYIAEYLSV